MLVLATGCLGAYPGSSPGTTIEYQLTVERVESPEDAEIIDAEETNLTASEEITSAIETANANPDNESFSTINKSTLAELNATFDNHPVSEEVYKENSFYRVIYLELDSDIYKIKIRKVGLS